MPDFWWRCEVKRHAHWDDWNEVVTHYSYSVHYYTYELDKVTPKGVWIKLSFGGRRFIQGKATKQFAVPTKELARQDELARRNRHISGCKARLSIAETMFKTLEGAPL